MYAPFSALRLAVTALAVALVMVPPVTAEEAPSGYWTLQLENDVWGSGDDRFYTHGTEFAYTRTGAPPGWLDTIAGWIPLFERSDEVATGYTLGQKIFTPEDTESRALVADDRPYAGWLFASAGVGSRIARSERAEVINGVEVTLGMVGPSAHSDDIQRAYHELIGVAVPRGWDHQLHDEPGFVVSYLRKWRYFPDLEGPRQLEVSPHLGAAVGNIYTYASAGLMVRWGSNLRTDIGPPNIRPGFPGAGFFQTGPKPNWYLFGGVEGRAVARDIFLDGNTFRDSHRVSREPFVGDVQFGVAVHVKRTRIALSNVYRTREFKGQDEPARYGAVSITVYVD